MSLNCELSGKPINLAEVGTPFDNYRSVVVTPSGHICLWRVLLQTLEENGGKDPFDKDRNLKEDQLVILQYYEASDPPITTTISSKSTNTDSSAQFTSTLASIQSDCDELESDLLNTRRALEESREEFSKALDEEDNALKDVAHMTKDCDMAKKKLEQAKHKQLETQELLADCPVPFESPDGLTDAGAGKATLSARPKDLFQLWNEYEFGLEGRKPAKYFSCRERGRERYKYHRRKIVWDKICHMIRSGQHPSAKAAIDEIYRQYGPSKTVSQIINTLRRERTQMASGTIHSHLAQNSEIKTTSRSTTPVVAPET